MSQDINDLVFEKLATVSRVNSVFELIWHLGINISNSKVCVTILFRNVATGECLTDEIPPEFLEYCSVGSFFKGGKKLESKTPTGIISDIVINVTEKDIFPNIGSVIRDAEYNLNYVYKTKDGRNSPFFADLCKKQKCMVFQNEANKVVIPCSVIAATYYLTSSSMRRQLLAQNLHGLYEDVKFDPITEAAHIILHRNANRADAKHIARFDLSQHAALCWDNIMNSIRSSPSLRGGGTPLSAKIPVVQQNLAMKVRCHQSTNSECSTTTLVHEILEERSDLPFKALYGGCRPNAPPGPDPFVMPEIDAESNDILTNRPPSTVYKNKQIRRFHASSNPVFDEVKFIQIQLSAHGETNAITVTEKDEGTVNLSTQRARGNDSNNRVAGASLVPALPRPNSKQRMAFTEFIDMVSGLATMEGVTDFFKSSDLELPCKDPLNRRLLTLLESYDKKRWNRRHYMYVSFKYKGKFVCLVEMDLTGLKKRIGTYVLVSACYLGKTRAQQVATDFVYDLKFDTMEKNWLQQGLTFKSKPHPSNQTQELLKSWRLLVLEKFVAA